ncbi:MAG: DHA2 family efflux MFS transporter permease subunit [Chromatiales bacterium]|nr:DHA2 family efflux MFS transporter permease subunit [Chromatiales bacterium]
MNAQAVEPSPLVKPWIVLATVSMCTMLYSLTLTIANVTLPQLQGAFSATPDQVSWIITLNIVATAVVTPVTGWFVARFGRRRVMLVSVLGFTLCTLLCATANSLGAMLAYRIGQGATGAPLVPLAQAIVVGTYAAKDRARAQGIFGMAVVLGPAVAPVLGGYLAEEYNWRWVFWMLLPLCAMSLISVLLFIHDTEKLERVRLDWTGFLTLAIAVTCIQLVMDRGEQQDWFQSGEIMLLTGLLVWAVYSFVVHTFTASNPFIAPALFLDRNFVVGLVLVFVYGMLNFTPIVLFPGLLQNLKGWPDSLIGEVLAARGIGMIVGFFIAGQMGRFDPRVGLTLGLLLIAYSGVEMVNFDLNVSGAAVNRAAIVQGIGCGVMWVPLSVIAFASLRSELLPQGSAIFHLLRNFGSSIFISVSVMAVIRTAKINYAQLTEHISPYNETLQLGNSMGLWSVDSLAGLTGISLEIGRQSQMIGYSNAFLLYTAACVAALPFLLLVRIKQ